MSSSAAASISQLRSVLSPRSIVLTAGDCSSEWRNATIRWQEHAPPSFAMSVQVQTVEDIQHTIRYANAHNIPFLVSSGKHGDISSLATLKNGIQIDMRAMNSVQLMADQNYAVVGGGIRQKELGKALAEMNRRTVTGVCDSVGHGGLAMGGGHGLLQGRYGLVSDQIVSVRMVTADGTLVKASLDTNEDLFWALRGAGHNFGIVSEFTIKTYPLVSAPETNPNGDWSVQTFLFDSSALEEVYTTANTLTESQSAGTMHLTILALDPSDPTAANPAVIIMYYVIHDGPMSELTAHTAPLANLKPLHQTSSSVPYEALSAMVFSSENDAICQPGAGSAGSPSVNLRFPVDFSTPYDVPTMRKMYDFMQAVLQKTPELGKTIIMVEQYPGHAVREIGRKLPDGGGVFPFREENVLVGPFVVYDTMCEANKDQQLEKKARALGERIREILQEGVSGRSAEEVHAYVNYANGFEKSGMKSWYGFEEEKLERLRALKREWDPHGRFSYYAPIE